MHFQQDLPNYRPPLPQWTPDLQLDWSQHPQERQTWFQQAVSRGDRFIPQDDSLRHQPRYDLEGDIIMTDMTEPVLIEKLTGALRRGRVKSGMSRISLETDSIAQTWPENIARVFVVDTNYWLAHLGMVEGLVKRFDKSRAILVIPWVVLQELDGLKQTGKKYMGETQSVSVAAQAQRAITFINKHLGHAQGLHGQRIDEMIDASQINDDGILDCARYFKERRRLPVTLLSNDVNLGNKFKVLSMGSMKWEAGLSPDDVLRRVLDTWTQGNGRFIQEKKAIAIQLDLSSDDEDMPMDFERLSLHTSVPARSENTSAAPTPYPPSVSQNRSAAPVQQAESSPMSWAARAAVKPAPAKAQSQTAKLKKKDPFAGLIKDAGPSIYAKQEKPTPPIANVTSSQARSKLPRLMRPRDALVPDLTVPIPPDYQPLYGLLKEVCETILKACPPLARQQLAKDLGDVESDWIWPRDAQIDDLDTLLGLVNRAWSPTFSSLFASYRFGQKSAAEVHLGPVLLEPWYTGMGFCTSNDWVSLNAEQLQDCIEGWADFWRKLANGLETPEASNARELICQSWTQQSDQVSAILSGTTSRAS